MIAVSLGLVFQCLISVNDRKPSMVMKQKSRMQNGQVEGPHLPVRPNIMVMTSIPASDDIDA
jgi:hypothetical protein